MLFVFARLFADIREFFQVRTAPAVAAAAPSPVFGEICGLANFWSNIHMNIALFLQMVAEACPGRRALTHHGKHYTYAQLISAAKRAAFHFSTANCKIVPKETAGVLIRIRGASGTLFDPTFLNYQVSEQTRLRQITVEIFVREGLDSAINIDRESFSF